jgi:O-antigen biosynthesis protein
MLNIFTLHWNEKDKLERLYKSLIDSLHGINYKWYIKDNGSNDGSKEFLESINTENIQTYYTGHNRHNFSEGMNILFDISKSNDNDNILMINNDLWIIDKNSIKNMINIIDNDYRVGLVGGRILYPDGITISHAGVCISSRHGGNPWNYRRGEKVDKVTEKNREFQAVTAAVALTKAKYFKSVCTTNKSGLPGFSEKFIWMFDDVDFSGSIKFNLGKKVVYCGKTLFYHDESASLKKNPVNKLFQQYNVNLFKEKWGSVFKSDIEFYSNPNYMIYNEKEIMSTTPA